MFFNVELHFYTCVVIILAFIWYICDSLLLLICIYKWSCWSSHLLKLHLLTIDVTTIYGHCGVIWFVSLHLQWRAGTWRGRTCFRSCASKFVSGNILVVWTPSQSFYGRMASSDLVQPSSLTTVFGLSCEIQFSEFTSHSFFIGLG